MNGFECADCGECFEFPSIDDSITWEDFQGHHVRHEETTLCCPECNSFDIEECRLCETCKTDRAMDGMDYCFAHLPQETRDDDRELIESMRNT